MYLTLLEEARYRYFGDLGLLEENRFGFVLAQTNVLFLAPGRGGAEVDVDLATTHFGASSFTQAYRVRAVLDGATWCEAEARLVAFDPVAGRKRAFTDEFRRRVTSFEGL